jgi:RNA polymerase sigma-70 factor (ECF subfamily)
MKPDTDAKHQTRDTVSSWVELYTGALYSWALHKTSSKEQAEDLVQETFLTAFEQADKFRGDSSPQTWLFGILNKKIALFYRKKYGSRQAFLSDDKSGDSITEIFFDKYDNWKADEKPSTWVNNDINLLDDQDFNAALNKCLESLPERSRAIILLKFIEQKKGELICQELNISTTNFWQLLHRAKLMLRKCIDNKWFKS